MKKLILILMICFPIILLAQKGTIVPDIKQTTNTTVSANTDGTKTWFVQDYLVNCLDTTKKCYLVKENGINKSVPQDDVYDFVFEDGFKYTLQVKEEVKPPPVNAFDGIYNYVVVKIISKKDKLSDASSVPTVTKNTAGNKSSEIPTPDKPNVYVSPETATPEVLEEIQVLKKQIKDLKKQVDVMQLQLDMQFQLMQKKQ